MTESDAASVAEVVVSVAVDVAEVAGAVCTVVDAVVACVPVGGRVTPQPPSNRAATS